MPREDAVLARVRAALNAIRAKCIKTSGEGEPDLVCSVRGATVVIETKQPRLKPEPLQYQKLREWDESGALALWTNDGRTLNRIVSDRVRYDVFDAVWYPVIGLLSHGFSLKTHLEDA